MAWNGNNSNGGQQPQRAPIIPTAFDDRNWTLFAEGKIDGGQSVPSMKISVAKNQPRITVYTGRRTEKGAESIWARMNPYAFYNLLGLLEQVAKAPGEARFQMKNDTMIPDRNNPGKKKQITESTTWVGKDENGVVYIAVTKYNMPNIQFQMKPPRFHEILEANGQPMALSAVSVLVALNFVQIMRNLLAPVLALAFDSESQSVPQRNGNGNSNWKGNGNSNSGYSSNNGNQNNGNWNSSNNSQPSAPSAPAAPQWNNSNDSSNDDDNSPAFAGLNFG